MCGFLFGISASVTYGGYGYWIGDGGWDQGLRGRCRCRRCWSFVDRGKFLCVPGCTYGGTDLNNLSGGLRVRDGDARC